MQANKCFCSGVSAAKWPSEHRLVALRNVLLCADFCEIGEFLQNIRKCSGFSAIDPPIGYSGGPCEQVDVRCGTAHEEQRQARGEARIDLGRHHEAHESILERDKMSVGGPQETG